MPMPDEVADTAVDHRGKPRRRGEALERVIFAAALAELGEMGYSGFSMERVAERARTGKASVYRRWASRAELVVATIGQFAFAPSAHYDTGELREDLLRLLHDMADRYAGPYGEAVRGLTAEAMIDRKRGTSPRAHAAGLRDQRMQEILIRAAARGEIHPAVLTPRVMEAGPVILTHHFLVGGAPISESIITAILDEVVMPLLRRRPSDPLEREPGLDPLAGLDGDGQSAVARRHRGEGAVEL